MKKKNLLALFVLLASCTGNVNTPIDTLVKINEMTEKKIFSELDNYVYGFLFNETLNTKNELMNGIMGKLKGGNFSYSSSSFSFIIQQGESAIVKLNSSQLDSFFGGVLSLGSDKNLRDMSINQPEFIRIYQKNSAVIIFVFMDNIWKICFSQNVTDLENELK